MVWNTPIVWNKFLFDGPYSIHYGGQLYMHHDDVTGCIMSFSIEQLFSGILNPQNYSTQPRTRKQHVALSQKMRKMSGIPLSTTTAKLQK